MHLAKVRVDDRERSFALLILNARQAEHASQLFSRHFHWAGRWRSSGCGLRESGGHRRVKSHVAFDLLKDLVNVTV